MVVVIPCKCLNGEAFVFVMVVVTMGLVRIMEGKSEVAVFVEAVTMVKGNLDIVMVIMVVRGWRSG